MYLYLVLSWKENPTTDLVVAKFASEEDAAAYHATKVEEGCKSYTINREEDLYHLQGKEQVQLMVMVAPPETKVPAKFETRAAGAKRIWPYLKKQLEEEQVAAPSTKTSDGAPAPEFPELPKLDSNPGKREELATMAKKAAKKARKEKKTSPKTDKRVRFDKEAKINVKGDKNPCRSTSKRYKSFELMRDGMLVKTYYEKGGAPGELRYAVKIGYVEISK